MNQPDEVVVEEVVEEEVDEATYETSQTMSYVSYAASATGLGLNVGAMVVGFLGSALGQHLPLDFLLAKADAEAEAEVECDPKEEECEATATAAAGGINLEDIIA